MQKTLCRDYYQKACLFAHAEDVFYVGIDIIMNRLHGHSEDALKCFINAFDEYYGEGRFMEVLKEYVKQRP